MGNNLKLKSERMRKLIIKSIQNAKSGHPGGSLSIVEIINALLGNGAKPNDIVLSKGHGAPALYAGLAVNGYVSEKEFVENLRKPNAIFQGHPERVDGLIPATTGSLGQGISIAAGMAYARKLKGNKERVYVIVGDGELQEGQAFETLDYVFAHKEDFSNLTIIIDNNRYQLTGKTSANSKFIEVLPLMAKKYGVKLVRINGHNIKSIERHMKGDKLKVIIADTVKGKGFKEVEMNPVKYHGKVPPVHVDIKPSSNKGGYVFAKQEPLIEEPERHAPYKEPIAVRKAIGERIEEWRKKNKQIIVLSPDLGTSVKFKEYIETGIREQFTASFAGGLAAEGLLPVVGSFAAFVVGRAFDQIRLNQISGFKIIYVGTHGGLDVGKDGATHQALEDISLAESLGLPVIVPIDANQAIAVVDWAMKYDKAVYIRTGRSKWPILFKYIPEFKLGSIDIIRKGNYLILSYGEALHYSMKHTKAGIVNVPTLSLAHTNEKEIAELLNCFNEIAVVESHREHLGRIIAKIIAKHGLRVNVEFISLNSFGKSGEPDELLEMFLGERLREWERNVRKHKKHFRIN